MGLSGLQVGLTTLCIAAAGLALGLSWQIALTVGAALALSSTAIVMQTLMEKGLMTMPGGGSTFATLLTQDIAVIPLLALIPLLASLPHSGDGAAHDNLSLVDGLPGWQVTLVTLGAVAVIILAGTHLINPIFRHIHSASLREMPTALALLIVVGIAVPVGGRRPVGGAGQLSGRGRAGQFRVSPSTGKRSAAVQGPAAGPVVHHRRCRHRLWDPLGRTAALRGPDAGPDRHQGGRAVSAGLVVPPAGARPVAVHAESGAGGRVRLCPDQLFTAAERAGGPTCRGRCC